MFLWYRFGIFGDQCIGILLYFLWIFVIYFPSTVVNWVSKNFDGLKFNCWFNIFMVVFECMKNCIRFIFPASVINIVYIFMVIYKFQMEINSKCIANLFAVHFHLKFLYWNPLKVKVTSVASFINNLLRISQEHIWGSAFWTYIWSNT